MQLLSAHGTSLIFECGLKGQARFYTFEPGPCQAAGLTASAGGLAQLLAQARHGLGLAAHAQERALGIGALLQHRAGSEDLPAQFLRGPGKEELRLDEAPLEERDYRLAQPGDVALPLRAHDDASGVLCAQRCLVPTAVDLVEDE